MRAVNAVTASIGRMYWRASKRVVRFHVDAAVSLLAGGAPLGGSAAPLVQRALGALRELQRLLSAVPFKPGAQSAILRKGRCGLCWRLSLCCWGSTGCWAKSSAEGSSAL